MIGSRNDWKKIYNRFNHLQRLGATDMDLFVHRPGATVDAIETRLELDPRAKWVVCGSMGSGKSSELVRLYDRLKDKYAVVGIDLPLSASRVDRLTPAEVLFLIGAGIIRAAEEVWGEKIDERTVSALKTAFQGVLAQPGINVSDLLQGVALFGTSALILGGIIPSEVGPQSTATAQGLARASGAILTGLRPRKAPRLGGLTPQLDESAPSLVRLQEAVDEILSHIRRLREPLLLVDGLDKVQERETMRALFANGRVLCKPDAPIVYSAPITLMLSTEWKAVGDAFYQERLTNIVVTSPSGELDWLSMSDEKIKAGRDCLEDVVARRLRREGFKLDGVFDREALAMLITASGGVLRDLMRLVRLSVEGALRSEKTRIDTHSATEAVNEYRREFEITFTTKRVEELKHVRKYGETSGEDMVSSELLLQGHVLPYSNGRVWFEPHPILRGLRPDL